MASLNFTQNPFDNEYYIWMAQPTKTQRKAATIFLRKNGVSIMKTAELLKCSHTTVSNDTAGIEMPDTHTRGICYSKLTAELARAIRKDALTMKQTDIAIKYNISVGHANMVIHNKIWAGV